LTREPSLHSHLFALDDDVGMYRIARTLTKLGLRAGVRTGSNNNEAVAARVDRREFSCAGSVFLWWLYYFFMARSR